MCSKKTGSKNREKIHGKDGKLPGYQITADDNADNWREEIVKIRNLILESKEHRLRFKNIKSSRVIRYELYGLNIDN
jgi:hypothetical protein